MGTSGLLGADRRVTLRPSDIELALADLHVQSAQRAPREGVAHPRSFLPAALYSGQGVDASALVLEELPRVLEAHPAFLSMAEAVLEDDFQESVYFGGPARTPDSLDFAALCRRLVASLVVVEQLLALDHASHRALAVWYEALLEAAESEADAAPPPPHAAAGSMREALMANFLAVKGESVLASINAFATMRRLEDELGGAGGGGPPSAARAAEAAAEVDALSAVLGAIMGANIFEAVVSNLSFAFWPENARAGMALLLTAPGGHRADGSQSLDARWRDLYLAWNACFIWPSHFYADMLCFSMLLAPTISLGDAEAFGYLRAHSLFWVVRSTQLSRLANRRAAAACGRPAEAPCFRCRTLEPAHDRQPITSRTALLTGASGERLAAAAGEDVSGGAVWWRLALQVAPQQLRRMWHLWRLMPKSSPTKLRLL